MDTAESDSLGQHRRLLPEEVALPKEVALPEEVLPGEKGVERGPNVGGTLLEERRVDRSIRATLLRKGWKRKGWMWFEGWATAWVAGRPGLARLLARVGPTP